MESWPKAINAIKKNGVVVIPTDTLYGIVSSAFSKQAVKKIFDIKERDNNKPPIILITSLNDLKKFDIKITKDQKEFLDKIWPGKVSVILPCTLAKWSYLHLGKKTLAFRMIGLKNKNLFNAIKNTGPIIAPSANPQGANPAQNITEARAYFGDTVDIYVPGVIKNSKPSTLIEYKNGEILVLREGAVKIER